MAFPVIGGTQVSGYNINNSLRFNNPDDPSLSKTFSSAGNRRTFTISAWIKKGDTSADRALIGQGGTSIGNPRGLIFVGNSLRFTSNTTGSSTEADVETNAKLRDHSAWYHLVVAVDTTQGTAANRIKLYINGEQQTSLAIATYPDQNFEMNWNNNVLHTVGRYPANDAYHMDGYISEFYFIDGTQHTASNFGETDDNGVWIPKNYTGSYGTNGFKLEFKQLGTAADADGIGADTSGNDNHFSQTNVTPALDRTVDTPTNNFATMNPLSSSAYEGSYTFAEGNTEMHWTAHATALSTMGVSSGKWYVEVKKITSTGSHNGGIVFEKNGNIGTLIEPVASEQSACGVFPLTATGELYYNQTLQQSDAGWTFAVGDILQYYIDLDNGTLKVKKNGSDFSTAFSITLSNSNDYSSGATTFFAVGYNGDDIQVNFGNPAFSISSSNSDPNGYGSFEYSTNDGTYDYYALCTKNLAEYG